MSLFQYIHKIYQNKERKKEAKKERNIISLLLDKLGMWVYYYYIYISLLYFYFYLCSFLYIIIVGYRLPNSYSITFGLHSIPFFSLYLSICSKERKKYPKKKETLILVIQNKNILYIHNYICNYNKIYKRRNYIWVN